MLEASSQLNEPSALNSLFLLLAGVLVWCLLRTGGLGMLRMVEEIPVKNEAEQMDGQRGAYTWSKRSSTSSATRPEAASPSVDGSYPLTLSLGSGR